MYKIMVKRVLAALLCFALLVGNLPVAGFAAEADDLCENHREHTDCSYVEGQTD